MYLFSEGILLSTLGFTLGNLPLWESISPTFFEAKKSTTGFISSFLSFLVSMNIGLIIAPSSGHTGVIGLLPLASFVKKKGIIVTIGFPVRFAWDFTISEGC